MATPETNFSTPYGDFNLFRYPVRERETGQLQTLRAWDAADEYLLAWLFEKEISLTGSVLIANDSFGALSLALHASSPYCFSDSFIAHQGCRHNASVNNIDASAIHCLNSLALPEKQLDVLLIKIPKTLALLEDELYRFRPFIGENTLVVGAGMVKGMQRSTFELFEKIIGPTTTSLAKKKARLIFCTPNPESWCSSSPYPSHYKLEGSDFQIANHANVFSRSKLDIGTRLFVEYLRSGQSSNPNIKDIVDLGCGNGLLGLMAADRYPAATVHYYDESYMAIASSQVNFEAAFGEKRKACYQANNCLDGVAPQSADLILNNPPFHQQHVIGDFIAWQMFKDSFRVLREGGALWVIGNRHLNYHLKLKKLFGNVEVLNSDKKFVLLKSTKRF